MGKENENVKAWLDDHLDSARSYFSRSSRHWMHGCVERAQAAQTLITEPRSSLTILGRRRVSHPLCGPSRGHVDPATMERPCSCLSVRQIDNPVCLDQAGGRSPRSLQSTYFSFSPCVSRPKCFPQSLSSPRPAGQCKRGEYCNFMMRCFGGLIRPLQNKVICQILQHLSEITQAQRCSLSMTTVNKTGVKCLGPIFQSDEESVYDYTQAEWDKCIMGYVISTGRPLNIRDAREDPRFQIELYESEEDRPKSILSVPILNHKKEVIGVVMAVNKNKPGTCVGSFFPEQDEKEPFSKMVHIEHKETNCSVQRSTRDYDSNDISYMYAVHVRNLMETLNIINRPAQISKVSQIRSLIGTPLRGKQRDNVIGVCQLVNKMAFTETEAFSRADEHLLEDFAVYCALGLQKFNAQQRADKTRAKLAVTKEVLSYQISASQEKIDALESNFSSLEVLALMIASLCHDLDHRGVNNSYIERSNQPLAQLYDHSTLEHHHYDMCLLILNSPGSQILSSLSLKEYRACVQMIEKNILATDLAIYIEKRTKFFKLAQSNSCLWTDEGHRELLRSLLMTASDICAITKPWAVQKWIAELVATEFYAQGDREKCELNVQPMNVMDRENSTRLPHMQVDYIDGICSPFYEAQASICESCSPLKEGCRKNRKHWQQLANGGEDEERIKNLRKNRWRKGRSKLKLRKLLVNHS